MKDQRVTKCWSDLKNCSQKVQIFFLIAKLNICSISTFPPVSFVLNVKNPQEKSNEQV